MDKNVLNFNKISQFCEWDRNWENYNAEAKIHH